MDIDDKLRFMQRLAGKSQKELADELGVSFPTLNSWINGKSIPRSDAAERIDALYRAITGQNTIPAELLEAKKLALLEKRKNHSGILNMLNTQETCYCQLLVALTHNTNSLDGGSLNLHEIEAILFDNTAAADTPLTEQMMVKNHQAAFRHLLRHLGANGPIDEGLLLKLHAILTNGIDEEAGSYRKQALRVTGFNTTPVSPAEIPSLMEALLKDIQGGSENLLGFAARIHSRFMQIQPFTEGSNKIGRLLLAAMLLREDLPPAIIPLEKKRFYILFLNQAQRENDPGRLEDLICDGIMEGYNALTVPAH